MARYVTVTSVNTHEKIPRVLELFAFRSDSEAYDFADKLAKNNRFEFVMVDINGDPVYAQAYEIADGSVEYRTIQVKKNRRV